MKSCGLAVAVAGVLLASQPAYAWWDKGHMEVAAIAYPLLEPSVRAKVDALVSMNPDYGAWTQGVADGDRGLYAFVHAATWADDIKKPAWGYTNEGESSHVPGALLNIGYADRLTHRYWHYKDIGFSPDGTDPSPPAKADAEMIIGNFSDTLAAPATPFVKSYDLVWLIHLVGDAHQPLHATERATHELGPDAGGNDESIITSTGKKMKLHAFWDSLPGDSSSPSEAIASAQQLAPADPGQASNIDPASWFRESFELAKTNAYTDLIKNGAGPYTLTPDYEANATAVANKQVALAGARLAALLNAALKSP